MNNLFKPAETVEASSILNLNFFTNKENTIGISGGVNSSSETESTTTTGKKRG